jgi:hypothetical protein
MKNRVYFLAVVLLSLLASCSSFKGSEADSQQEVVFDDGYKTTADDEVIFDDKSFVNTPEAVKVFDESSLAETTEIAKDGSQISTKYDGFGNKTETRTFNNNPLLRFLLLRTGVDGKRQVTVYGQYGEVKSLPENMLDKIFTASPKELANSAGIYEVFREQHSYAENTQQPNITLKPLPSSQFSVPNQQSEQTPPEEIESPIETTKKTVSSDDDSSSADKKETITLNKKPVE